MVYDQKNFPAFSVVKGRNGKKGRLKREKYFAR
jgi:hypothetical protein